RGSGGRGGEHSDHHRRPAKQGHAGPGRLQPPEVVAMAKLLSIDVLPFFALFLPLAGFLVLSLFEPGIRRDWEDKGAALLACATVVVSFLCLLWTALHLDAAAQGLVAFRLLYNLPPRATPFMPYPPFLGSHRITVTGVHLPL